MVYLRNASIPSLLANVAKSSFPKHKIQTSLPLTLLHYGLYCQFATLSLTSGKNFVNFIDDF